ncbi:hypothetical protein AJ88_07235 [Mesorhizobium amorphae CCBAU 01583]|nr:hypothetical protein AJ88_07235 [Mesorhizobium amorphae CCBAU 01583]
MVSRAPAFCRRQSVIALSIIRLHHASECGIARLKRANRSAGDHEQAQPSAMFGLKANVQSS